VRVGQRRGVVAVPQVGRGLPGLVLPQVLFPTRDTEQPDEQELTLTITGIAADSALAVIIIGAAASCTLGKSRPAWVRPG
jgi:hypothetical protein